MVNGLSLTFKYIKSFVLLLESTFNVTQAPGYWCAFPNSAKLRSELMRLAWCTSAAMMFSPLAKRLPSTSNVAYAFSSTIVLLAKVVCRACARKIAVTVHFRSVQVNSRRVVAEQLESQPVDQLDSVHVESLPEIDRGAFAVGVGAVAHFRRLVAVSVAQQARPGLPVAVVKALAWPSCGWAQSLRRNSATRRRPTRPPSPASLRRWPVDRGNDRYRCMPRPACSRTCRQPGRSARPCCGLARS